MNTVRIEIPKNPTALLALAAKIAAKHATLAGGSPLKDLNWTDTGPVIADGNDFDAEAADHHRQAESLTEKRDAVLPVVADFVRSSRDVLLGLHRKNPRALSDFGFVV